MPRLALLILICAALFAACGGSRDDGGEPDRAPAAGAAASGDDGFVAAGDDLCRRLAQRYPRARADRLEQSPAAGLKAASSFREYTRELNAGLRQLSVPADAEARQILVMTERLAAAALSHKIRHKRIVAARQGGELQAAFRAALDAVKGQRRMVSDVARPLDRRMRAYGFEVCGRTVGGDVISAIHAIIYSSDAEADRAFLRDVLGFASVDAGGGWLIFELPPAELAVHPHETSSAHELYLMCDDIHATVRELLAKGVDVDGSVSDEGWGLLTAITLPGGGRLGLYEPRHPSPPSSLTRPDHA